jgi:hypothetical protein
MTEAEITARIALVRAAKLATGDQITAEQLEQLLPDAPPDGSREQQRNWRERNKDRQAEMTLAWRQRNLELARQRDRERKRRERERTQRRALLAGAKPRYRYRPRKDSAAGEQAI